MSTDFFLRWGLCPAPPAQGTGGFFGGEVSLRQVPWVLPAPSGTARAGSPLGGTVPVEKDMGW